MGQMTKQIEAAARVLHRREMERSASTEPFETRADRWLEDARAAIIAALTAGASE